MMANLIACRLASYANYQDCAWWHLPQIGVSHVEVDLPQTEEEDATLRRQLETSGLAISAFSGRCEVKDPQVVADLEYQFERCAAYGVKILFVSVRAENVDRSAGRHRAVDAAVAGMLRPTYRAKNAVDVETRKLWRLGAQSPCVLQIKLF